MSNTRSVSWIARLTWPIAKYDSGNHHETTRITEKWSKSESSFWLPFESAKYVCHLCHTWKQLLLAIWRLGDWNYQSHVLNPSWHFLRWSTIRATGNVVLEREFRKNEQHGPIALGIWTHMCVYINIFTHIWYHHGWLQGPRRDGATSLQNRS